MKKKPNGFVSVLLALCLLLAPMTVFAESNAQLNYVTDDAGILTDSQWEDLEQRAQQVSEEYQCGVYMITVDDLRITARRAYIPQIIPSIMTMRWAWERTGTAL